MLMLLEKKNKICDALASLGVKADVVRLDMTRVNITCAVGAVYLLMDGNRVAYVGQTGWLAQRIVSHMNFKLNPGIRPVSSTAKKWDSVWFIAIDEERRNEVERELITLFADETGQWQWRKNPHLSCSYSQTFSTRNALS